MGLISNLREAQRNATGAAVGAIASILSLPHATIAGLADAVNGKSFNDASMAVMNKYAAIGYDIGREKSDEIVRQLIEAHNKK
jgi:hypothetical protein